MYKYFTIGDGLVLLRLGLVFQRFPSFCVDRNDLYNPEFITLMISVMNFEL